jgi:hypothetical protein
MCSHHAISKFWLFGFWVNFWRSLPCQPHARAQERKKRGFLQREPEECEGNVLQRQPEERRCMRDQPPDPKPRFQPVLLLLVAVIIFLLVLASFVSRLLGW